MSQKLKLDGKKIWNTLTQKKWRASSQSSSKQRVQKLFAARSQTEKRNSETFENRILKGPSETHTHVCGYTLSSTPLLSSFATAFCQSSPNKCSVSVDCHVQRAFLCNRGYGVQLRSAVSPSFHVVCLATCVNLMCVCVWPGFYFLTAVVNEDSKKRNRRE